MALKGMDRLKRKLKRIPQEVRTELRQALAAGANDIVATQKNLAPVRTGALRDSIVATLGSDDPPRFAAFRERRVAGRSDPDLTMIITAGNEEVRTAHLVEFGAPPHTIRSKTGKAMGSRGQFGLQVAHPGAPAQPFFYPGWRAHRKTVKARITRAITKAAKKAARS